MRDTVGLLILIVQTLAIVSCDLFSMGTEKGSQILKLYIIVTVIKMQVTLEFLFGYCTSCLSMSSWYRVYKM